MELTSVSCRPRAVKGARRYQVRDVGCPGAIMGKEVDSRLRGNEGLGQDLCFAHDTPAQPEPDEARPSRALNLCAIDDIKLRVYAWLMSGGGLARNSRAAQK
jgi:hypothetical protein